jgi:transcriptional regulator with XRE-family HTH domain
MDINLGLIRRARMQQKEVAAMFGVSKAAISRFERGELGVLGREKRAAVLKFYAELAGMPVSRFGMLLGKLRFTVHWYPDHVVVQRGDVYEVHYVHGKLPVGKSFRDMRRPYMSLAQLSAWTKLELGRPLAPSSLHKFERGKHVFDALTTAKLIRKYVSFADEVPMRIRWRFRVTWKDADTITVKRGSMRPVTYQRYLGSPTLDERIHSYLLDAQRRYGIAAKRIKWQRDAESVHKFVRTCIQVDATADRIRRYEVYAAYMHMCALEGVKCASSQMYGYMLAQAGARADDTGKYYTNVRLLCVRTTTS